MDKVRAATFRDGALLIALGAVSWVWASVWLQGMPFFTDDYDRWLAAAHDSTWLHALRDLANPWGGIDATWGFTYRPVIVVFFKLFGQAGASSSLFFAAKSGVLAALIALVAAAALRVSGSWLAALLASSLLLTSHGVLASMSWGGDLAVMADLCILGALCGYAWLLTDERRFIAATLVTIGLSLLAMQTKGDGRLLGGMFIVGLVWADPKARRRAILPAILCCLMALPLGPWLKGMPFLGNKALPSGMNYVWHAPSLSQVWDFTLGGTINGIEHPTVLAISQGAMLWPLGWVIAFATIVFAIWRWIVPRAVAAETTRDWAFHFRRLIAAWCVLSIAATSSYPAINPFYQHRYAIDLVAPLALLAAMGMGWMLRDLPPWNFAAAATPLCLAALFQTYWGVERMLTFRESFASVATIADRLNRSMAEHKDAKVRAYVQPYVPYDYWPTLPGNDRTLASADEAAHLPDRLYMYSWDLPIIPDLEKVKVADGSTGAWIEQFYRGPVRRGYLTRHVGPNPIRSAGRQAAQNGRWADAIPLLTRSLLEHDTVLERHLLGTVLIRTGRYAEAVATLKPLMEPDGDGPKEVRYNLALALLEAGDARGAAEMYERLVREDPRDVDSVYNLAVAYRRAGELREAVEKFRATLALRSNHPGALANLRELGAPL